MLRFLAISVMAMLPSAVAALESIQVDYMFECSLRSDGVMIIEQYPADQIYSGLTAYVVEGGLTLVEYYIDGFPISYQYLSGTLEDQDAGTEDIIFLSPDDYMFQIRENFLEGHGVGATGEVTISACN